MLLLPAGAAGREVSFEHLSLQHGLSQSSVFDIVQDRLGFMWFATQDGLNRYDGHSFVVYRQERDNPASLSHNYLRRLFVDAEGYLWVGTANSGVNRYDPQTGRFQRFQHDPENANSISDNSIWVIGQTRDGVLWFGTDRGLNAYDPATGAWSRHSLSASDTGPAIHNMVRSFFEDSAGVIWVGFAGRIFTFNRDSGRFNPVQDHPVVNKFLTDNAGRLWAVGEAIMQFDDARGKFVPHAGHLDTGEPVSGLGGNETALIDRNGDIWIGSFDGLIHFNSGGTVIRKYNHHPDNPETLSSDNVISLWEDRSGILWAGTYNGINKYAPVRKKFSTYTHKPADPNSLSSVRVRGFSEDRSGAIWIATQHGLNRFDPATESFTRYLAAGQTAPVSGAVTTPVSIRQNHIWSVTVDRYSAGPLIYLGLNGAGVDRLEFDDPPDLGGPGVSSLVFRDPESSQVFGGTVLVTRQSAGGDMWFGYLNDGAARFRPATGEITRFRPVPGEVNSMGGSHVNSIMEDRSGTVWFGSYGNGVTRFDPATSVFTRFTHQPGNVNSLGENNVISIYEDSDGILWFGTYGGLNRFDPSDGTFRLFTTGDGLANNVIYAIEEDARENLWLSSNRGLTRFNRKTFAIMNYDISDGLQDNEFNRGASLKASTGELYFGGISGFNRFYPDHIRDNSHVPNVVLVDFRVFNRPVIPAPDEKRLLSTISTAQELFLSGRDASITFEFAALEFTNPLRNQFAWMLEGFEEEWNFGGTRREATYTNLDPGYYVFRVKASNNDNVWNEEGVALAIFIAPPWWMTWWFRALLVVTFLSAGPVIYYRRVSHLKTKHAQQQEISRRLIESQEAERKRIASELHDSVGQDLLVIKNRILMGLDAVRGTPEEREREIREAAGYITKSLANVRHISRNLRPVQLDQLGLTAALESVIETVVETAQIDCDMKLDRIDGLLTKEGEINLFRIVQESLNNVVKHSGATEIRVHLRCGRAMLLLEIQDNGKGMDGVRPAGETGLGLPGMFERARILGGELNIKSDRNTGTTVRLNVPLMRRQNE